jgi:hypothetical protein
VTTIVVQECPSRVSGTQKTLHYPGQEEGRSRVIAG